jgi:hypothetical protein
MMDIILKRYPNLKTSSEILRTCIKESSTKWPIHWKICNGATGLDYEIRNEWVNFKIIPRLFGIVMYIVYIILYNKQFKTSNVCQQQRKQQKRLQLRRLTNEWRELSVKRLLLMYQSQITSTMTVRHTVYV